jgi:ABC-2 type transport system ATP-binding protein
MTPTEISTPTLEIRDLTLRYDETTALDQLSLTLPGGKIYGLLGRNGSGKTSLLSVLAAFRKANSGEVLVDGQPVFENPWVTPQLCLIRETGDTTDESESAQRALDFAAAVRPNWDGEYAKHLTERFELDVKKKIKELSRGKRAALGITLGLASRAPITMFDESYLGLDAPSRYIFYDEILADYQRYPRTMIISTHLIEEVSKLFEEVIIIDRGRLVLQEETSSLLTRGTEVTGATAQVEQLASGYTVLSRRELGPTTSAVLYGSFDDAFDQRARALGIEVGPVPLQDLFVHLTVGRGEKASLNADNDNS